MGRISKIRKIDRIENNLKQKHNEKEKSKNADIADFDSMLKEEKRKLEEKQNKKKKTNSLDAYKFEIQKSITAQKKISQINNEERENEHDEK